MDRKCVICGVALSRYNENRVCFACQVKGRDSDDNSVVITSRRIHPVPRQPVEIRINYAYRPAAARRSLV
jgi:hypothetical protein